MKQILKLTFILLLMVSGGRLHAQKPAAKLQGQSLIDSLLQELPRQKEDTNKVKLLEELSESLDNNNPDLGLKYGQDELDLATELNWKKGIALANNSIAINYRYKSDYPNALTYDFKSLKLFEEIGSKEGIATASCNIGIVYDFQKDYPKALEYYFKALKLDEKEGYKQYAVNVIGDIGIIYQEQKDYPRSLEYYFKALKLYEELNNKPGIANNTNNIGGVYMILKNYSMAVGYFQISLKMSDELDNKYLEAAVLGNIGLAYIGMLKDTAGIENKMTASVDSAVNKYQPAMVIPTGRAARLANAIDHLQRGVALCKKIKALDLLDYCYTGLADAYKLKGDYRRVVEYVDSSMVIKDSLFSEANTEQIKKLENGRKQYGDSLKAVAEKRTTDIKAAHRRNYELIGGGVMLLLSGFTFVVIRKNKLLDKEKKRSDKLLLNILPEEVANQLKETGSATATQFDNVTVLFTDFINFTAVSELMKPQVLLEELNTCFKAFDEITIKYSVEKIKTIGDAYLAVCGLPTANQQHAEQIIKAAIEINSFMQDRFARLGNNTFDIRIGVHSGSVVAGIVGTTKFAYDIWGDAVNIAARMEQNSEGGKINMSETTYELVKDKFNCLYRGEIAAKGKGAMKMYYVAEA